MEESNEHYYIRTKAEGQGTPYAGVTDDNVALLGSFETESGYPKPTSPAVSDFRRLSKCRDSFLL
jgi:hypothetical protein